MATRARGGRPKKLVDHQLFSLRLPSALHGELRHFALDEKRSLNDILVATIQEWWAQRSRASTPARPTSPRLNARRPDKSPPSSYNLRRT